jgi:Spy/CpxP family protein refolding chaperone
MSHMPVAALIWLLLTGPVLAQHQHGPQPTPYAGLERRAIKALSDEQIADLRAGRGMGLALVAELNGYPGPIHVLEHTQALGLSPEQRARVQALYEAMRREAAPVGEKLIQQEGNLDGLFAERTVTQASLERATAEIGQTQAALRAAHLKYHLATLDVLTPAEVNRYVELRGYRPRGAPAEGHGRGGKH